MQAAGTTGVIHEQAVGLAQRALGEGLGLLKINLVAAKGGRWKAPARQCLAKARQGLRGDCPWGPRSPQESTGSGPLNC